MAQFLKNILKILKTFIFKIRKAIKIKIENVTKIASKLDLVKNTCFAHLWCFVRFLFIWKMKFTPAFCI